MTFPHQFEGIQSRWELLEWGYNLFFFINMGNLPSNYHWYDPSSIDQHQVSANGILESFSSLVGFLPFTNNKSSGAFRLIFLSVFE
jgi:hypothetical protein